MDEVFVKINGVQHYLWRAVDHEGEVLESYVTKRRDRTAALKFLKKAMKRYGQPEVIVTPFRDIAVQCTAGKGQIAFLWRRDEGYRECGQARDRALEEQPSREFTLTFSTKGTCHAPLSPNAKFAEIFSIHASIFNHFNQDRSLSQRGHFKLNRTTALVEWRGLCAA